MLTHLLLNAVAVKIDESYTTCLTVNVWIFMIRSTQKGNPMTHNCIRIMPILGYNHIEY